MPIIKDIDQHAVDRLNKFIIDLPPHMRDGVRRYVLEGKMTGGFLTSVFENDFARAVQRADAVNYRMLSNWAIFLFAAMPSEAWGSPSKVSQWMASGGLKGQAASAREPKPAFPKPLDP
jgi:hypothetical protein